MKLSETEFKILMRNSHAKINTGTPIPTPNMEQSAVNEQVAKKEIERFNSPVNIVIHSYRKRACDPDGISAKAVIDGIVKSGLLKDDSAKYVKEVRFKQTKIKKGEEEKTIVEITEVADA